MSTPQPFGGKGNRLGGEIASDGGSAAKGDATTVRTTADASANIPAHSPSHITTVDHAQPEGTHEIYNHFNGEAGDKAGAYGGNANLGSQKGAHIYIGASPQSPPVTQATVSGIHQFPSHLHDCTIS